MKLTPKQQDILKRLAADGLGEGSAYSLQTSLATLEALSRKGLVRAIGFGHMAFPRTANWKITQAGRDAATAT